MVVSPRAAVVTFTSIVMAFVAGTLRAGVEVYPGPGVDAVRSSLYTVEVFNGSSWIPAYVYGFSRLSKTHWHPGTFPTVNFLTFGTTGPVNVRVSRIAGSISAIDVSPHSKKIPVQLSGGRAVLTLNQNHKVWITLNSDDANPLFIFADPPKPPVPPGATYAPPGIWKAPGAGNHYKAKSNEVIYLDGGAWMRGTIDLRNTRNVRIVGPGILSGDLWVGEEVGSSALPFDQFLDYAMIRGEWFGGNGASVEGITIVDSPGYNFFGGATNAYSVKILSPWFYSTDGFQGVSRVDQSFVFNGDNALCAACGGVQNDNVTITSSFAGTTNNSVFSGGYWGFEAKRGYSAFVSDIDIKTYINDDWVTDSSKMLAAAFQTFVDNSDPPAGYWNQTYQDIRIEGNLSVPLFELKNLVYIWGGGPNPPLGNSRHLVFRNITLEGTQKYRSEIKGWDQNNGFHDVVLENVKINGTTVDQTNVATYFDINSYVWGLSLGSPATVTKVVPIVLDLSGSGGARFSSELTLANRGTTTATLQMAYVAATSLGASGSGTVTETLGPGRQVVFPDTIAYLRGKGLAIPTGSNQGGTLFVTFNGLSSADVAFAGARTTAPSAGGRAGLAYPAVRLEDGLTGTAYLFGLRENATDRSNLALVNLSTAAPIVLRVTLHGDGRTATLPDVPLGPGQWMQIGHVLSGPGFASGFVTVDLVSGSGPFYTYAVFNDNTTQDGSFVPPTLAAGKALLPVLVETSTFQSELVLANPTSLSTVATLSYLESLSPSGGAGVVSETLGPYEQKIILRAVDYLRRKGIPIGAYGAGSYAGALRVSFPFVGFAGARTAAPSSGGGEYGVFYGAFLPSETAPTEAWVFGLQQNAQSRSNLAVVNTGNADDAVTYRLDVYDGETGKLAGSSPVQNLPAGGWQQFSSVLSAYGVRSGYVRVVRLSGSSWMAAYGVVNDGATPASGATNDGSFVAFSNR